MRSDRGRTDLVVNKDAPRTVGTQPDEVAVAVLHRPPRFRRPPVDRTIGWPFADRTLCPAPRPLRADQSLSRAAIPNVAQETNRRGWKNPRPRSQSARRPAIACGNSAPLSTNPRSTAAAIKGLPSANPSIASRQCQAAAQPSIRQAGESLGRQAAAVVK